VTQESSFSSLKETTPKSLDAELREIEKAPDVSERDLRYLMLGRRVWETEDYKGTRACASNISDGDVRSRFNALIDFREAAQEFDHPRPNVDEVETIIARLTDFERRRPDRRT
jgi:hypothetical protein